MSTEVRWRDGTAEEHEEFTGAQAEVTVDTTNYNLRVHDGVTPGGHRTLMESDIVDLQREMMRGVPFPFPGETPPPGAIAYNGAELQRGDFPELWTWAQQYARVVSEIEWSDGLQGCFSEGDGLSTFRVPDLRGEFLRGLESSRSVGSRQGDAIRNMTGKIGYAQSGFSTANYTQGVFEGENEGSHPRPGGTLESIYSRVKFDASRVVPTANEIRPRNVAYHYCAYY